MLPMLDSKISMNFVHSSFKFSDVSAWSSIPTTEYLAMNSLEANRM